MVFFLSSEVSSCFSHISLGHGYILPNNGNVVDSLDALL